MVTDSTTRRRWSQGPTGSNWLLVRWSLRDLRSHWIAVVVIALVLAIGTGVFAGLGSTATWRRQSNDASFSALGMHDLQVTLSPGTFVDQGALEQAVAAIDGGSAVIGARERLVVDSQVSASGQDGPVLLAARLVGMSFGGEPAVDNIWVSDGSSPEPGRDGGTGLLEAKFADFYGLPPQGTVTVAGGRELRYVGLGIGPEDFFYEGPEGSIFGEGELAIAYVPLIEAQRLVDRPGQVNDLVLRLAAGTDRAEIEAQLDETLAALGVGADVTNQDEAYAFRVLYDDIDNDQRTWNALSALILLAAGLAAFNLVSRIVEAQRREIGIGMALGVAPWRLAVRALLIGIQVGLLGTVLGVGVGFLLGRAMEDLLRSFLPMPIYRTPFQLGIYVWAAALGLVIPVLAAAIPVWRAVRVEPIKAIRTGHLTAKSNRLTDWTSRIHLPGSSLNQMPFRNVVRNPRRAALTAVGVGAAITSMVAVLGLLDSFVRALDQAGEELTQGNRDRVFVQLDTFYPADSEVLANVGSAPAVGSIDSVLRLPVRAQGSEGADDLDLLIELVDLDSATWTPTIADGGRGLGDGITIAAKAAADLGVGVGDIVTLLHPARTPAGEFMLAQSQFTVDGIHANPIRAFAYADLDQAERFGLAGAVNLVYAYPDPGASRADVQRSVFGLPGVTSSQAVARISEGFEETLAQFSGVLVITAGAVLALALLIAFNASRITVEERRREHATMRAFGLPVRSVLAVVVKESVLIGLVATVLGLAGGIVFMSWMLDTIATTTAPDIGIAVYLSPSTLLTTVLVGVIAVAVAPVFLARRIWRMDLPATLRVVE
ncbi:MAG: FtsX-like permease family protein [Actinomycetia bacterium]|nr:FtsX-like permease family protein [Actinomycetes bacterium]